jgi:hypothetical protein
MICQYGSVREQLKGIACKGNGCWMTLNSQGKVGDPCMFLHLKKIKALNGGIMRNYNTLYVKNWN